MTPEKKLRFTDITDFMFLHSMWLSLAKPENCAGIMQIQEFLNEKLGEETYSGPISQVELAKILSEQSKSYLESLGMYVPSEPMLRWLNASQAEVTYVLEPKWLPAVFVEASHHFLSEEERRDNLFRLMIDGQSQDEIEGAISEGWIDPSGAYDVDVMMAQDSYDLSRRAGEILLTLAKGVNLSS